MPSTPHLHACSGRQRAPVARDAVLSAFAIFIFWWMAGFVVLGLTRKAGHALLQDGMVQSAKEAFEAMSASGGWSVYTNKVARRISDGGASSSLAHEMSL